MPQLMLIACFGFIFWLFRQDMAWRRVGSSALLIPGAWLAIQGSRPVSYWFGGAGGSDANPINTVTFLTLIGAAVFILTRRRVNWSSFIKLNKTLCLVYAYFALTALWSDAPFISLKRIFKDFGSVLLPLVLLTQGDSANVIRAVFVRVSYLLFPLSVVFIKYFPNIGRSFSRSGEAMFGGVTTQKNSLGEVVFVFGLMVIWDLVEIWRGENRKGKNTQIAVRLVLLLSAVWLLLTCDSKTSVLCLVLGVAILWGCGRLLAMRRGKQLLIGGLVGIVILGIMDSTFGISDMVIRSLGRDPTLTGRTEIWQIVLKQDTNPIIGSGFYTFWDSAKGKAVMDEFMQINSAHNGYLELYVDGGLVGDFFLCVFLLAAGIRIINRLFAGDPLGIPGLIFWLLSILYNLSETSFFRLDPLWFTLLMLSIKCPKFRSSSKKSHNRGETRATDAWRNESVRGCL